MNPVHEKQNIMIEKFGKIASWQDRYKEIIAMGKSLPDMPEDLYQEQFLVKGCQSRVWVKANQFSPNVISLQADSDAMIVKGLVALLVNVYSDAKSEDILSAPTDFVEKMGFSEALSPSRANGFVAMLKQIHLYASAFQLLNTK